MCWSTKKEVEKKIATENINVFKIVYLKNNKILSPIMGYEYMLNKQYKLRSDINIHSIGKIFVIRNGYHSYSNECTIYQKRHFYGFRTGEYSVLNSRGACLFTYHKNSIKLECIIPKGSEYYINEDGEYVSNSIIPVKLIKLE